ncbi:MAG: pccA [Gammaproteobacteria bacterium]|nr:pccA [Gammaproteobacteria bacterium]
MTPRHSWKAGSCAAKRRACPGARQFAIRGVNHNIGFLAAIMGRERFASGKLSTDFIPTGFPDGFHRAELSAQAADEMVPRCRDRPASPDPARVRRRPGGASPACPGRRHGAGRPAAAPGPPGPPGPCRSQGRRRLCDARRHDAADLDPVDAGHRPVHAEGWSVGKAPVPSDGARCRPDRRDHALVQLQRSVAERSAQIFRPVTDLPFRRLPAIVNV